MTTPGPGGAAHGPHRASRPSPAHVHDRHLRRFLADSTPVAAGGRAILLQIADQPVVLDAWMILALTGAASGVVLVVTALSLPVLLRAMRPDGLRTE